MAYDDIQLSPEFDEGTDSSVFSPLALVAFLASLAGIFSIAYIHVMPIAVVGTLLGVFTLLAAKKFNFSRASRLLAFLAVALGATVVSWGLSRRYLHSDYEVTQARRVAEQYLDRLSAGDLESVYFLVGFQFEGMMPPNGMEIVETDLQKAKRRLAEDPAHVEIRNRRSPAKWTFLSLDGEAIGTAGYSYKLKYRDDGQTNPPTYFVYARKDLHDRYGVKPEVHWYVDNIEVAK